MRRSKERRRRPRRDGTRHRQAAAGFTLIEVLLAAGLLVAGMSMILGVFNFGSAMSRTAELRSLASGTVEAVMHDLEDSLFLVNDDGTIGEPRAIVDRPVPGRNGVVYTVTATGNPKSFDPEEVGLGAGLPREYIVEVTVKWQASGVKKNETWTTIMLREQPFGARMRRLVGSGS
ncbi:general secretion pathway protein J [Planctomycetes bacterium Poly30]|uniref:General secretion pathway protein J n=1 Tax=Saltatorellus ferox TaxID=2528018 RepID=A0A518EQV6_9BACT|nr:general secretion pathway protein J [Planctomycetes bacterium Poly30]